MQGDAKQLPGNRENGPQGGAGKTSSHAPLRSAVWEVDFFWGPGKSAAPHASKRTLLMFDRFGTAAPLMPVLPLG